MTMDKNILQIIVLRNPLDCMLSAFAHGEELRPSGGTLDGAIRYLNKRYTDLMGECHKYFDNIDFYLFEDIDNVPLKIASNFVDIPQDYQPIIPTRNEKHIPSMVDSEFYAEIKKAKIDYSWYKDANEAYQSIINRLKNVGIIE